MPKKRYNAEEIIHKLREADVLLSQEINISHICKQLGIAEQTYYRWRKAYGGMKVDQAKRLKELEAENARWHHSRGRCWTTRLDQRRRHLNAPEDQQSGG